MVCILLIANSERHKQSSWHTQWLVMSLVGLWSSRVIPGCSGSPRSQSTASASALCPPCLPRKLCTVQEALRNSSGFQITAFCYGNPTESRKPSRRIELHYLSGQFQMHWLQQRGAWVGCGKSLVYGEFGSSVCQRFDCTTKEADSEGENPAFRYTV